MDRPFDLLARATPTTYINGRKILAEEDEVNLGRFQLADGGTLRWWRPAPAPKKWERRIERLCRRRGPGLDKWPDFDSSPLRRRDSRGNADRLIEILGLYQ